MDSNGVDVPNTKGSTTITVTADAEYIDPHTGTGDLVISGVPNVTLDLTGLPPSGNVGRPYNGQFTCTNVGTADAPSAECSATGLPDGVTVGTCTISPSGASWSSPAAIPEGQTVTCPVSGTPTQTGDFPVAGTGGSSTGTQNVRIGSAIIAPVPTMSEWGQMLMAGLLAALGLAGVRRMRRAD